MNFRHEQYNAKLQDLLNILCNGIFVNINQTIFCEFMNLIGKSINQYHIRNESIITPIIDGLLVIYCLS